MFTNYRGKGRRGTIPVTPLLERVDVPLRDGAVPKRGTIVSNGNFSRASVVEYGSIKKRSVSFVTRIIRIASCTIAITVPRNAFNPCRIAIRHTKLSAELSRCLGITCVLCLSNIRIPRKGFGRNSTISMGITNLRAKSEVTFSSSTCPRTRCIRASLALVRSKTSFIVPGAYCNIGGIVVGHNGHLNLLNGLGVLISINSILNKNMICCISRNNLRKLVIGGTGVKGNLSSRNNGGR